MDWIVKDCNNGDYPLTTVPKDMYGFIYVLVFESGKHYIGKKTFWSTKTLPSLKNGTVRPKAERIGKNVNGKRKYFDVVKSESNWKPYTSSAKDIPKEDKLVGKYILKFAHKKQLLSYLEDKELFAVDACANPMYYNKNISGRYYDNIFK